MNGKRISPNDRNKAMKITKFHTLLNDIYSRYLTATSTMHALSMIEIGH